MAGKAKIGKRPTTIDLAAGDLAIVLSRDGKPTIYIPDVSTVPHVFGLAIHVINKLLKDPEFYAQMEASMELVMKQLKTKERRRKRKTA